MSVGKLRKDRNGKNQEAAALFSPHSRAHSFRGKTCEKYIIYLKYRSPLFMREKLFLSTMNKKEIQKWKQVYQSGVG